MEDSEVIPDELIAPDTHGAQPDQDVELKMMFFTETALSENGLYYLCRRGTDAVAYFGASMVKYLSGGTVFTLEFPGSNTVIPHGERPTGSTTNYLYGNTPSKWKTGVEDCSVLRYPEIYPGIDLVYKIQDGNLKYEFVVSPFADPDVIRLDYVDAESILLEDDTVIATRHGQRMSDSGLEVLQKGGDISVECRFFRDEGRYVRFSLDDYDQSMDLIIDPVFLAYSTFLGGSDADQGWGIAVENGYAYVTGCAYSTGFPVVNAYDPTHNGNYDCFVSRLSDEGDSDSDGLSNWEEDFLHGTDPYCFDSDNDNYHDGHEIECGTDPLDPNHYPGMHHDLQYSSYLGGSLDDMGYSIAIDAEYVYVAGDTLSPEFTTLNAFDATHNGNLDIFIVKLSFDCRSILYSTFIGGISEDCVWDLAVENGYAYVTGHTESFDFPMQNAFNSTYGGGRDCFVTKLATDGQSLMYSTFLGGALPDTGQGIAVEESYAYVAGYTESSDFPTYNAYDGTYDGNRDCFVTKFAADGQSLLFSTFLGGHSYDYSFSIAVEEAYVYVTGYTLSSTFPTANAYDDSYNGNRDCYVTKFAPDGQSLIYSTFLGGSNNEQSKRIAVEDGYAYITGHTESSDFPTFNAYNSSHGGNHDAFVTKLTPTGNDLIYSTFIGGACEDYAEGITVENGWVSITGYTSSPDYPTTSGDGVVAADDCFITTLSKSGKNLVYSVCVRGEGTDQGTQVVMKDGTAYVTGFTNSTSFPTMLALDPSYAGGWDTFIIVMGVDSDRDGICNSWEERIGSDPYWVDSDNDNFLDFYEFVYGSNATDPNDYPAMPQTWYDAIYADLDGNSTLIQQIITWLDGNHTAIETLFTYVEGNATLLLDTVDALEGNATELAVVAALATTNYDWLEQLNATAIANLTEIREVLNQLGATVGDADYDGLDDIDELEYGTDLQCIDTDCDNLNDAYEIKIGTDPLDDDTDADSYLDGAEILSGTDPLDPNSYPGSSTETTPTTSDTDPTTSTTPPPDESPPLMMMVIVMGAGIGVVVIVAIFLIRKRRAAG
jgi:hypothetical protein